MIALFFSPMPPEDLAIEGLTPGDASTARGSLHDVDGRPVVRHGAHGTVRGHLHAIDPARRDETLATLDRLHDAGPDGQMRTIAPIDGRMAWSYHWVGGDPADAVASGDWSAHADPRLL